MSLENILDVMESFYRIKPRGVILRREDRLAGVLLLLMSCIPACVERFVLFLLYNPKLEVQDIARLKQLKERQKVQFANLFNAKKHKEQKKDSKKGDKEQQEWHPEIPVLVSAHASSAACLALQKGKLSRLATQDPAVEPAITGLLS